MIATLVLVQALAQAKQPSAEPVYTLVKAIRPGQTRTFSFRADFMLDQQSLGYEGTMVEKIMKLNGDGSYVQEVSQSNAKMIVEGQETPVLEKAPLVHHFDAQGSLKKLEGPEIGPSSYRQTIILAQLVPPTEPIPAGASYTVFVNANPKIGTPESKIEVKIVGLEDVLDRRLLKIMRTATEIGVVSPASVEETLWLDPNDFGLVKADSKVKNLPMEGTSLLLSGRIIQNIIRKTGP